MINNNNNIALDMGCCNSKKNKEASSPLQEKKTYSWDKREQIDASQFIIDGVVDQSVVRRPGSINGQQFVIQNCKNTRIFLLDHMATVTVDDCIGCQIILGPIKGSVFFRDCQDCKCIVSCQQFRTRDCSKMDIFLCCSTQPIIETSSKLRFGCYQLAYDGLLQQFANASLNVFNNNWNNIHDFTPVSETNNWIVIPEAVEIDQLFNLNIDDNPETMNGEATESKAQPFQLSLDHSVVPWSRGSRSKNVSNACLVVVFHNSKANEMALSIINELEGQTELIQTRLVALSLDDAKRIFCDNVTKFQDGIKSGPVIGLELSGDDCINSCNNIVKNLSQDEDCIYVSSSPHDAARDINNFFNFCDMQLSA